MAMMPSLGTKSKYTLNTATFMGYNHNPVIADGQMYDMNNLSSDAYPLLGQRKPRGTVQQLTRPAGLLAKGELAIIDGERLIYGGQVVHGIKLSTRADMLPKKMVSMGAYLVIWPDKIWYNTATGEGGMIDAIWERRQTWPTNARLCRRDGTDMVIRFRSKAEPEEKENGDYWIDISEKEHVLKQWNEGTKEWVQIPTVYTRIEAPGIGAQFAEYDVVRIQGMEAQTAQEELREQVEAMNTSMILYGRGDDYIIVAAILDDEVVLAGRMTVSRKAPELDYLVESENRLWGCRTGMVDGQPVNEIMACAQGDFRNWERYMGLSTDSYRVTVGTDGPFTGAATLRGYPCFFKEGCVHRIGGSMPSQYTVITTQCRGVQEGSWRSLQVVGEYLFYKSKYDVMVFDGTLPVAISEALGAQMYDRAVAGVNGDKYYISMRGQEDGAWQLMVYDNKRQMWHREDNTHVMAFAELGQELYWIDAETGCLMCANGTEGTVEDLPDWEAVMGVDGFETENQKYLSRYNLRMMMTPGSRVNLYIEYDSSGEWEHQGEIMGKVTNTFMVPVIPRRCDHCRLKIKGEGVVKIYSISRQLEIGGDG